MKIDGITNTRVPYFPLNNAGVVYVRSSEIASVEC
jgi:hypothetical protein